jgi:hypothetical protein
MFELIFFFSKNKETAPLQSNSVKEFDNCKLAFLLYDCPDVAGARITSDLVDGTDWGRRD